MKLSCCAVCFFVFIVIFAIFVANVSNVINNLSSLQATNSNDIRWMDQENSLKVDDSSEHLMWFVQISDIHISIFSDKERIEQFRDFTTETLKVIRPDIVLASGDLTDARDNNIFGSRQYKSEWEIYRKAIDDSDILNKTIWLDIRGNHDNFNVPGEQSNTNYFRNYSVQGKSNNRSYMKQIHKGTEVYTFVAVDASLNPGPKRPFNFIGFLNENDISHLNDLVKLAKRNGGNYTIWFGHYPTSCIISTNTGSTGLRRLIGQHDDSLVYLCGHLHNFGGTVPRMFTLQNEGFLELELGDWKKVRWFRIGVVDHGLFSFVDTHYNEWPIVVVTNPKNYLFNIPHREHPGLQRDSTHIRILAFSTAPINNCLVRLNDQIWLACKKVTDNLFVVKWDPHLYLRGVHKLEVNVTDDNGKNRQVTQMFALDNTRAEFDTMAKITLMSNASDIFKIFFGFAVSFCVVPLIFLRLWHIFINVGWLSRPHISCSFLHKLVRQFWILSTIDRIFLPIILYCIYLTFGPWSIIEVIDGHYGFVFFHGIYLNGGYVTNPLSSLNGFFQLMLCQLPINFIFSTLVNRRYCDYVGIRNQKMNKSSYSLRKLQHAPFILIVSIEIILGFVFWNGYGVLGFLFSPFRTWSVAMNIILWYQAKHIPDKCLRSAALIWTDRKFASTSGLDRQE